MKGKLIIISAVVASVMAMVAMAACAKENDGNNGDVETVATSETTENKQKEYVLRIDTLGLKVLYPKFSRVELVCGTMPSKDDEDVVLVLAAAYTGKCFKEFKHSNIVGMHVSGGKLYNGGTSKGAFVYYNGKWKFATPKQNKVEMQLAAENNGAGFTQEILIYNGEIQKTDRNDTNSNIFRALCEHNGKLCVIESQKVIKFGEFKKSLKDFVVTNAIYTDMGSGWNHAWYRTSSGVVELQPYKHPYCTNWVTFYK